MHELLLLYYYKFFVKRMLANNFALKLMCYVFHHKLSIAIDFFRIMSINNFYEPFSAYTYI